MEIDLRIMFIFLFAEKFEEIRYECRRLFNNGKAFDAEFRSFIGKMVVVRLGLTGVFMFVRCF